MRIYWSVGFPGWRIASHLGCPIKIKVDVCRDIEAGVYFATSEGIGLAVESESLDGLMKEIHGAIPALLEICHSSGHEPKADIRLHDDLVAA
jgi:predicted HicB family RNase H-like nuclease